MDALVVKCRSRMTVAVDVIFDRRMGQLERAGESTAEIIRIPRAKVLARREEREMAGSTTGLMATPAADRPIWKHWTFIGGGVIGAIEALETADVIPGGLAALMADLFQLAGGFLAYLGTLRHIPTK